MEKKQCRIWWPKHYLCQELSSSDLLLFGWYMNLNDSSNSFDVVVALAISALDVSHTELQGLLQSVNLKLPMPLQEASTFCMLGDCGRHSNKEDVIDIEFHVLKENTDCKYENGSFEENMYSTKPAMENHGSLSCGCQILNQSLDHHKEVLIRNGNWIHLIAKSKGILEKEARWVPEFHHMHQNGRFWFNCDIHLILFEPPTYGKHHFSVVSSGYCKQKVITSKKPNWVDELYKKPAAPNLEIVVEALNCANAAMVSIKDSLNMNDAATNFYIISRLLSMLWHMLAVCIASLSTAMYIILQLLHRFLRFKLCSFFSSMLQKIFTQTGNNIHIRSCQFLYWAIFLSGSDSREQLNVEYAHLEALKNHSIWSTMSIDIIMGICFGIVVFVNIESIHFGILFIARNVTENILRLGCVWLMGVPAGFKLNTELAELLGMVSLNAIQIFSTMWFLLGSYMRYFIRGLAFSGILFGLTVPAALCIDMLKIATLHIQTLHQSSSFIYSRQIQALASLWRLFRGRKWNPLRQRLDSYDYTVDQHVVGSLLFTPLLLLLPTTTVFYTFFTILNVTVCFICITIELAISVLHATPYAEILLWVARRRNFPSGIWFKIVSAPKENDISNRRVPDTVVCHLHSNYATIAQIVASSYRNLFQRLRTSIHWPSAYGILSGQRAPSTLQVNLQPSLPWIKISCREYWRLCYRTVVTCRLSK